MIRNGSPLPVGDRLELMQQVLAGLHYAHKAGVVHRDIKPSNLMIDGDGVAKILDFRIARHDNAQATKSSRVAGTAAYMAPEQILGEPIDRRATSFSLAAVLQEFLTGQKAFEGETDFAIMQRILNGGATPFEHPNSELAQALTPLLAIAMARDPGDRYPDAQAFGTALQEARGKISRSTSAATVVRRSLPPQLADTLVAEPKAAAPAPTPAVPPAPVAATKAPARIHTAYSRSRPRGSREGHRDAWLSGGQPGPDRCPRVDAEGRGRRVSHSPPQVRRRHRHRGTRRNGATGGATASRPPRAHFRMADGGDS